MKIHRGVVVEIKDNTVIVLTPEADIKEVETNGQAFKLGDEILFHEIEIPHNKGMPLGRRVLRYVAGLAAGLLIFFSSPLSISDLGGLNLGGLIGGKKAYAASVYVESKSNVKANINEDQEVIGVEPLNKPGERVIKGVNWQGKKIGEFVQTYFAAAKQTGYLGPEDKAVIAIDPVKSKKDKTIETIQKDINANTFIRDNEIQVFTVTVPDIVVKKANDLGLTPGKFSIYLAAKVSGEKMPLNVVKVDTVTELVDAVPIVAKVLPNCSEEQLAQLVEQNAVSKPKTEVAMTKPKISLTTTKQNVTSEDGQSSTKPIHSEPASGSGTSSSSPSPKSDSSKPDPQPTKQSKDNGSGGSGSSPSPSKQPEQKKDNNSSGGSNAKQPDMKPQTQNGQGENEQGGNEQPDKQPKLDINAQIANIGIRLTAN